jgi:hypothetical protein
MDILLTKDCNTYRGITVGEVWVIKGSLGVVHVDSFVTGLEENCVVFFDEDRIVWYMPISDFLFKARRYEPQELCQECGMSVLDGDFVGHRETYHHGRCSICGIPVRSPRSICSDCWRS